MADASARFGSQPDLVSAWLFFICDSPTTWRGFAWETTGGITRADMLIIHA
jgi:hypothetical protein